MLKLWLNLLNRLVGAISRLGMLETWFKHFWFSFKLIEILLFAMIVIFFRFFFVMTTICLLFELLFFFIIRKFYFILLEHFLIKSIAGITPFNLSELIDLVLGEDLSLIFTIKNRSIYWNLARAYLFFEKGIILDRIIWLIYTPEYIIYFAEQEFIFKENKAIEVKHFLDLGLNNNISIRDPWDYSNILQDIYWLYLHIQSFIPLFKGLILYLEIFLRRFRCLIFGSVLRFRVFFKLFIITSNQCIQFLL